MNYKYYVPFSHLTHSDKPGFHPSKIYNDFSGYINTDNEIFVENLHKFLKDAFTPNEEDVHKYSNETEFLKFNRSKQGFVKTFDVIMTDLKKNSSLNILDLAAGDFPFFKRLAKIRTDLPKHVSKKINYVAVDKEYSNEIFESVKSILKDSGDALKFTPHKIDLTREEGLRALIEKCNGKKFNMIILSNAFHELAANRWPDVLAVIPQLLHRDGRFVLLDLINPMEHNGSGGAYEKFVKKQSFWESDAIYCQREEIFDFFHNIDWQGGLAPDDIDRPYWYFIAKRDGNFISNVNKKAAVHSHIKSFVENRLSKWKAESSQIRKEVMDIYNDPLCMNIQYKIFVAIRYLCLCATNTKMHECFELLKKDESA
jgi:SAM-dependent methyltransferase